MLCNVNMYIVHTCINIAKIRHITKAVIPDTQVNLDYTYHLIL